MPAAYCAAASSRRTVMQLRRMEAAQAAQSEAILNTARRADQRAVDQQRRAAVFLRKVADLASGTGEETRAVPLNELDDMRIDRDSLEEDLANARSLMELYKQEADQLRARLEVSP